MKKLIMLILLGCSMTSFALFDKIKKEIKWKEEEKPRFNQVKVTIDGKEKMRKVIPGRYEIKLFEITYPTDLFGKNRFYNEFNAFLKNIKKGKKYSLLLEDRFYQEMQDIKVDQLSEEEKILELPASSLDEYYRQQIIAMSNGVNLTEYVGTDQEYLNRQIYVLYELLNKTDFDGRKVALIGVGNVERHGSDFCSGMSAFLPVLKKADLIGAWGAEGYKFKHSRAFINGKFVGLTIDFKGDEHWQARADKWIAAVKGEF